MEIIYEKDITDADETIYQVIDNEHKLMEITNSRRMVNKIVNTVILTLKEMSVLSIEIQNLKITLSDDFYINTVFNIKKSDLSRKFITDINLFYFFTKGRTNLSVSEYLTNNIDTTFYKSSFIRGINTDAIIFFHKESKLTCSMGWQFILK